MRGARLTTVILPAVMLLAGCASQGPGSLADDRLRYNEIIKTTTEQQLLLNIVRLRYTDSPNSLSVSTIAMQSEFTEAGALMPFFGVSGDAAAHSAFGVLPQVGVTATDRPTITLTPLDDQEFTRQLFTPISLEGLLYLAKTTWPIETVFRLALENLNWVSNAQEGSGPTSPTPPVYLEFRRGIRALQTLQDRNEIVFGVEEREQTQDSPAPSAKDVLEAARQDYSFRRDARGGWQLVKKIQQPVMKVDPKAVHSPEMVEVSEAFHLKPGLGQYDITLEQLSPFPSTYPRDGVTVLDLETRSLLQMLYFVANGVEVPAEHLRRQLARQTREDSGQPFDWQAVIGDLLHVHWSERPPPGAHVAIRYLDTWFYIDQADADSLATFAILMELSRMELAGKSASGLTLTLPLSGH
jgi:hypothetical protein